MAPVIFPKRMPRGVEIKSPDNVPQYNDTLFTGPVIIILKPEQQAIFPMFHDG